LLGMLLSLISVGLMVVIVITTIAAGEGHSHSGLSAVSFRRVAAYLLVPLIVSTVAAVCAWGVTVVVTGSIY
jgi:hypothetical protein